MELTAEENKSLEQIYGSFAFNGNLSRNPIQEVRVLTENEKLFFERKNFVSPHFCVQTLYKVKGTLLPIKFNRAAKNLVTADENFRANFCQVGERTVKVIFAERNIIPEIVFRVLNVEDSALDETLIKIMEADRRLSFDIQRGSLIRFSAFRTAEDESAILVTISQLISQRFNAENFLNAVFNDAEYKKIEPRTDLKLPQIEDRVREYWANVLKDMPVSSKIPFAKKSINKYSEENYRLKISADILSDLRGKAQNNRVMLAALLQTAWGFLLQATNKSSDVIFCQLISKNKSAQEFALHLIPVRVKSAKNLTVENLVTQQFKQLVVSQSYSSFDWATLESLTARTGNLFDHFLSFLDFNAEEKTFSQVEATSAGVIVEKNSWDAQGMKLGVYFQYSTRDLSISFQYDKNQFLPEAGKRLANIYSLILRQMLLYWNTPFENLIENIKKLAAESMSDAQNISKEDERKIINDFICKNKILQSDSAESAEILVANAKTFTRFEGDRLFGEILNDNLVFVAEGKLSRSLDTGDGWFNALDIIKAGGLINETVFFEKRRAVISAEVLTEKAVLISIPLATFESATLQNPALYKSVLRHVLSQMEKYQILWLQS